MEAPSKGSTASLITHAIAHCRAGFERETARDLERIARSARSGLDPEIAAGSALVIGRITSSQPPTLTAWSQALLRVAPVFARSIAIGSGPHRLFEARPGQGMPDRITPLRKGIEPLRDHGPFSALWIEYPDTNEGKMLSPLARGLRARLGERLRNERLLDESMNAGPRLHVIFADTATAWLGMSDPASGSAWPLGIPRLHMPGRAPSRSTLKLAEAFTTFLGAREPALLRAGMHAVDLGAAPGGWTWQLANRGIRVTAVDNADLRGSIAEDPLVKHVREDGLRFRPRRPVDWLVCDIVEQPIKIAGLVAAWIADGAARHAIFNLKLPMKKRCEEVERCATLIDETLRQARVGYRISLRQLYHDREEVTGFVERVD